MVKRKKGEDKLTDDAFEREMQALMNAQEEYKKANGIDESQAQNPEFKTGGGLPQYAGIGSSNINNGLLQDNYSYNSMNNFGADNSGSFYNPNTFSQRGFQTSLNPETNLYDRLGPPSYNKELYDVNNSPLPYQKQEYSPYQNIGINPEEVIMDDADYTASSYGTGLDFNKNRTTDVINRDALPGDIGGKAGITERYSAGPNYLGAGLSIGTSAITSAILASNAKKRKDELLKSIHTPKVQAQQVDYSRSRANTRSNQALTEATGRQVSKGARSASEAANIRAMARIGAQRVGGNQLSQSYQAEESQNANLRSQADQTNSKYGMEDQRQRMMIESKYGDVGAQQLAGFIKGSGQTISNAMNESDQKQQFYNALNMRDPNYELDFQDSYDNLSARQKLLARMSGGMGVNANKKVSNGQK